MNKPYVMAIFLTFLRLTYIRVIKNNTLIELHVRWFFEKLNK